MSHYEELLELFDQLSDNDKFRIICRFVLKLPTHQIALLENKTKQAIFLTFINTEKKLCKMRNHDEIVAALQEMFCN
jgi:hypothetical protein